jgi:hypothetical protein
MKHLKKPLSLSRETVRHLTAPQLGLAAGGITTAPPPSFLAGNGCTSFTNCQCPAVGATAECGSP